MMRLKTCIGNVIIYDTGSERTMTKWIYFSRPDPTKEFVLDSGVKRRITRKLRGNNYQIITLDMAEGQTEPTMDPNLLKFIATADLILFAADYKTCERCELEHKICETYKLPYIDL